MRDDDPRVEGVQTYCVPGADVHKPLLSISGCADMGFDRYLGDNGGRLLDKQTGEKIPLGRRDMFYIMRAWIRQDPGVHVSQPFVSGRNCACATCSRKTFDTIH